MLKIWVGTCKEEISSVDDWFDSLYDSDWFDDPFVIKMVEDVDKGKVGNKVMIYNYMGDLMPTIEISGGLKTLILMYKHPEVLYKSTSMGDNCGKWLIDISEKVDCFLTLRYDLAISNDLHSTEPFVCEFLNTGFVTKTIGDYFQEFYKVSSRNNGKFVEWIDCPFVESKLVSKRFIEWKESYKKKFCQFEDNQSSLTEKYDVDVEDNELPVEEEKVFERSALQPLTVSMKMLGDKFSFEFALDRKVTIISGDSAIGKTTLMKLVRLSVRDRQLVELEADRGCFILPMNYWNEALRSDSIFFIDDNHPFLKLKDLDAVIKKANCYFVIVSRDPCLNIDYGIDDVFTIISDGYKHGLVPFIAKHRRPKSN
jgi:hypothetical protein